MWSTVASLFSAVEFSKGLSGEMLVEVHGDRRDAAERYSTVCADIRCR